MKKLLIILLGAVVYTAVLGEWEYRGGKAHGYGSRGRLTVTSDRIELRFNGSVAKFQEIRINGRGYLFKINPKRKRAVMDIYYNRKTFKRLLESIRRSGDTEIEFTDAWGTQERFYISREGMERSFYRATIPME